MEGQCVLKVKISHRDDRSICLKKESFNLTGSDEQANWISGRPSLDAGKSSSDRYTVAAEVLTMHIWIPLIQGIDLVRVIHL